jgi:hypothetical protein
MAALTIKLSEKAIIRIIIIFIGAGVIPVVINR